MRTKDHLTTSGKKQKTTKIQEIREGMNKKR